MNKRFLGFILLLVGIVDVFVLDYLLSEVFGIHIYGSSWKWLEYLPYILSGTFVIFGLRLVFQGSDDNDTYSSQEWEKKNTIKTIAQHETVQAVAKQIKKQVKNPPPGTAIHAPIFPGKEKTERRLQELTMEQKKFVKGFSLAALLNPLAWAVVHRQPAFIAFTFVPMLNVVFWIVLAFKGREIVWVNSQIDYETLEKRERNALTIALIILSLIVVVSNLTKTKGF